MEEKQKFMRLAINEAKKAKKLLEVPVGAVIVKNGQVVSKAHNMRETKQNSLGHAEIIAINKACKRLKNFRLNGCQMYVTVEPCIMCAGAIVQSRIGKVYFGTADEKYGAVKSAIKIFDAPSNHRVDYEEGILKEECKSLVKDFFKDIRKNKSST